MLQESKAINYALMSYVLGDIKSSLEKTKDQIELNKATIDSNLFEISEDVRLALSCVSAALEMLLEEQNQELAGGLDNG